MKRKINFFLISLLFIMLAGHSFAEVNLTNLVENIRPAVVTVITYDKGKNPLSQGSGFFIDANGHLVTNYHVLDGAYHAEVKTYDGRKYPVKSVIGENKKMDLIKVLVDIPRLSVQWIEATRTLPSLAERIVVVGSPMGLEQTVSEGIVSSVREIPEIGKILQISASISSGSSGSPVVNINEQVIGVVSFYLIKGQNLNFAIPAQYFIDLKPFQNTKTISEWMHRVDQKKIRKMPQKSRLFVHTEPKGARVRILNIKPKFYQGIMLIPGPYHIEVSAAGYEMEKIWIKIELGEDKNLKISLKKPPQFLTKNPEKLILIGFAHAEKEEYKKAIEAFKQAIRIDPGFALAHYNLGNAYAKLGLYGEAIEAFKAAIRFNPKFVAAHYNLGSTYDELGLYRKAVESFKEAIRFNPGFAEAYYWMGNSYRSLNLTDQAIEAYKQAIRIDPGYATAYINLGTSYASLGLHREAINAYREAMRIDPNNTTALNNLGFSYYSLGYYRDAIAIFHQTLRINPDDISARTNLGFSYLKFNDRESAVEQYNILKTLDKESANDLFNEIYK